MRCTPINNVGYDTVINGCENNVMYMCMCIYIYICVCVYIYYYYNIIHHYGYVFRFFS